MWSTMSWTMSTTSEHAQTNCRHSEAYQKRSKQVKANQKSANSPRIIINSSAEGNFLRSRCTTADYKSRVMGRSFTIQSFVPFLVKFMQVQNGFIRDKERYLDSLNISDCRGRGKTNNRTERKDSLAHVF